MRDLTGAPAYSYGTADTQGLPEMALEWSRRKYIMTCYVEATSEDVDVKSLGLVPDHSYGVLDVQKVGEATLLRIRNPWGRGEWNGDWSDKSSKWTPELKERLGWSDKDDGVFWMDLEDVKKYFSRI